jgi:ParB-like chromosome segregation protein Spo0J
MSWVEIEIDKLQKALWNYKTEDAFMSGKLKNNIKKNGQLENIIVREVNDNYEVVNGNHRLDQFRELGFKKVMVKNVGRISQAAAERIAVETNETHFDADRIKLGKIIDHIMTEYSLEDVASTLPLSENEIQNLKNILAFDWKEPNEEAETEDSEESESQLAGNIRQLYIPLPQHLADEFEVTLRRLKALRSPEKLAEHVPTFEAVDLICRIIKGQDDSEIMRHIEQMP